MSQSRNVTLKEDELRKIIKEEFNGALLVLGIDATDPLEIQKDSQFVREMRLAAENIKKKSLTTIVGIFVTGLVGAIIVGVRAAIHTKTGGVP